MDSDYLDLSLKDYLAVVKRRRVIIAAITLVVVVIAFAYVETKTPVYEAEAQMLVSTRDQSLFNTGVDLRGTDATRQLQSEILILEGQQVSARVEEDLGLDQPPPPVNASIIGSTDVLSVRVRSTDAVAASDLANAYVAAFIQNRRQVAVENLLGVTKLLQGEITDLDTQIDALKEDDPERQALVDQRNSWVEIADQRQVEAAIKETSGDVTVVQNAEVPTTPVEPRPGRTIALAGVLGILVGLGAAVGLDYFDDSVHAQGELEQISGRPVLAAVPPDSTTSSLPVSVTEPDKPAAEAYRGLRTNIRFLAIDREVKTIVVTSAVMGEGKSTTAANLAVVLAQAGRRVALVDADLRRPRLHKFFDTSVSPGLVGWMVEGAAEPAIRTVILPSGETMDLVPAGKPPQNPGELLMGNRIMAVIDELARTHDHVLVDAAPVVPVADTLAIAGRVDGVLMVVDAQQAKKSLFEESMERLSRVGADVIGIIYNRAKTSASSYSYYGKSYGSAYSDMHSGTQQDAPRPRRRKRRDDRPSDHDDVASTSHEHMAGDVADDWGSHTHDDVGDHSPYDTGAHNALARRRARADEEADIWSDIGS